jgi:hypothetical protein
VNHHLPLSGVLLSVILFLAAAAQYPGGTTNEPNSVGFQWSRNFISALFQPMALNGQVNPARPLAIAAMLVLCLGLGLAFVCIARNIGSKRHKDALCIAGPGAMVYAFLIVTPMHDLMITMTLAFFAVASGTLLHALTVGKKFGLLVFGIASLIVLGTTAALYYRDISHPYLPLLQKGSALLGAGWLLLVHYSLHPSRRSL